MSTFGSRIIKFLESIKPLWVKKTSLHLYMSDSIDSIDYFLWYEQGVCENKWIFKYLNIFIQLGFIFFSL